MSKPVALLFPGQGAQFIGMGMALAAEFPVVAKWYERAEAACELPLRRILAEGPPEKLRQTETLQPALLTVEIGAWLALNELTRPKVVVAIGHSLGEYAALVAAGVIEPAEAVALVRKRGRFMQAAMPAGLGGMMAVIGVRNEYVHRACEEFTDEDSGVWVANDNCPGQVVVSGHITALKKIAGVLKEMGAKRLIALDVSAPFHSPLMAPVSEALSEELYEIDFQTPQFPVIANATAKPYDDGEGVSILLEDQVEAPVRFRESLGAVARYKPQFLIDLGPKPVISGLAKRTIPDIRILPTDTVERLKEAAKEIS